jgi:hypothetical protein
LLSDEETLTPPSDPLNNTVLALNRGRSLFFDGKFMPSATNCLQEVSTPHGSSLDLQLLFKFSSLQPTPLPPPPHADPT